MAYQDIIDLLGDQEPMRVLQASPAKLELYFNTFSSLDFEQTYAAGKWTARQITAHLADAEIVFYYRLKQMLHFQDYQLEPIDQALWARDYARLEPSLALESFRAMRSWNLAFFTTLTLEDWLKEGFHPELGMLSVSDLVNYWAGHDLNHLAQLASIAQQKRFN